MKLIKFKLWRYYEAKFLIFIFSLLFCFSKYLIRNLENDDEKTTFYGFTIVEVIKKKNKNGAMLGAAWTTAFR